MLYSLHCVQRSFVPIAYRANEEYILPFELFTYHAVFPVTIPNRFLTNVQLVIWSRALERIVSGAGQKVISRAEPRAGVVKNEQNGRSRSGSGVNLPLMAVDFRDNPVTFLVCPNFHPDQSWSPV